MAEITISFTTNPSASFYRVKYRQTGTTTYTTVTTTSSPIVISAGVNCGVDYEGTVQAVCTPGVPCYNYQIVNEDMYIDGDVEYTNCSTGQLVTAPVLTGSNFIVCSSTVPVVNVPSGLVNQLSLCGQGTPEEASAEVSWTATGVACQFYWLVTPCDINSIVPPNNAVVTNNSSIGINSVVKLTGSAYIGQDPASLNCYQITDISPYTTGVVVDAVTIYESCLECQNA